MAILTNIFSGGIALPITLALIPPFVAWSLNIATVHIAYVERLRGGMDSVLVAYESRIKTPPKNELSFQQIMALMELSKKNIPYDSLSRSLSSKELNLHLSPTEKEELRNLFLKHNAVEKKDDTNTDSPVIYHISMRQS